MSRLTSCLFDFDLAFEFTLYHSHDDFIISGYEVEVLQLHDIELLF